MSVNQKMVVEAQKLNLYCNGGGGRGVVGTNVENL